MAYNTIIQFEYKDINDVDTKVRIKRLNYAGAIETRGYVSAGASFKWGDSSNKFPVVCGSQCTIFVDSEADYEFLYLFSASSRKHLVEVDKAGSLFWKGFIEPDSWSEPLIAAPYPVEFTAFDMLGFLDDMPFKNDNGDAYEGKLTLIELIQLILDKTALELPVHTASDFQEQMQAANTDYFAQHKVNLEIFEGKTCLEVLKQVLLGHSIRQRNGAWWIISNSLQAAAASISYFIYPAGAAVHTGTASISLEDTSDWWFEGDPAMNMLPALRELTIKQDYGYQDNLMKNGNFKRYTVGGLLGKLSELKNWTIQQADVFLRRIDERQVAIQIGGREEPPNPPALEPQYQTEGIIHEGIALEGGNGNVKLSFKYGLMTANPGVSSYLFFRVTHQVGALTYYLRQFGNDQTKEIEYEWTQNGNDIRTAISMNYHYSPNYDGSGFLGAHLNPDQVEGERYDEINEALKSFSATMPVLPGTGTLKVYFWKPLTFETDVMGAVYSDVTVEVFNENEESYVASEELTVINDLQNNFVPDDLELAIGNIPEISNNETIYLGGLLRLDGNAASAFRVGTSAYYSWGELLGRLAASAQRIPRRAWEGTFADLVPRMNLVIKDRLNANLRLIETGFTYNDQMASVDGQYVQVLSLSLDEFEIRRRQSAESTGSSSGSSSGGGGYSTSSPVSATDEKVAVIGPAGEKLSAAGYLDNDYFEGVADELNGRTYMRIRTRLLHDKVMDGRALPVATGHNAIAIGEGTTATAFRQLTLGSFNAPIAGNALAWDDNDPLLVVGTGVDENNRRNGLVIYKNNDIGLAGIVRVKADGRAGLNTNDPRSTFEVKTPGQGAIAFGGANGRSVLAYNPDGTPGNIDVLAGITSFSGQVLVSGLLRGADNADLEIRADGTGNILLNSQGGKTGVLSGLDVYGMLTAKSNVGSEAYTSGFSGHGWRIDPADNRLTVDNLTVRKEMSVYELVINQIRGTNGALWVSDSAKVSGVSGNRLTIDTGGSSTLVPFVANDIIRCQRWTGNNIKYYVARVTAVGSNYIDVLKTDGASSFEAGDEIVRIGNSSNTSRQGAIYLTSSDNNAPYLDVLDGVVSSSLTGKTKVRLGKLDGITDADLGVLSGYGLYSENAYLKGQIVVTGGNAETLTGSQAKANAAQAAAETYALAKANLAETQANAYADGVASAAEQAAINAAQAKADAAEVAAKAYADGIVTTSEQAAIDAAKAYADAQDVVYETTVKAYADGIVSDEEARAIADAQAKADAARIAAINAAATDATSKANAAQTNAKGYTDTLQGTLDAILGDAVSKQITIIEGGLVKSTLLDVSAIKVSGGFASLTEAEAYAEAAADAIEVGGRNLLQKPNSESLFIPLGVSYKSVNISIPAGTYTFSRDYNYSELGDLRCESLFLLYGESGATYSYKNYFTPTESSGSFVTIFTVPEGIIKFNLYAGHNFSGGTDKEVLFTNLKIETGNKATAWTLSPEDVEAYTDTQAAAAQASAEATAAADASSKANAAQAAAESYADGLDSALKDAIVNGNTTIIGGYINTNLIAANSIAADKIIFDGAVGNNVTLSGTINAASGTIGGFEISNSGIVNDDGTSYVVCRNLSEGRDARIGSSVFPLSGSGVTYFRNEYSNPYAINYAVYAKARNSGLQYPGIKGSYAGYFDGHLRVVNGDFEVDGQMAGKLNIPDDHVTSMGNGSSDNYLSSGYNLFVGDTKTGNRTYYLPLASSYKAGEVIRIVNWNDQDAYVKPRAGDTINGYTVTQKYITLHDASSSCALRSNGSNQWMILYLAGTGVAF